MYKSNKTYNSKYAVWVGRQRTKRFAENNGQKPVGSICREFPCEHFYAAQMCHEAVKDADRFIEAARLYYDRDPFPWQVLMGLPPEDDGVGDIRVRFG